MPALPPSPPPALVLFKASQLIGFGLFVAVVVGLSVVYFTILYFVSLRKEERERVVDAEKAGQEESVVASVVDEPAVITTKQIAAAAALTAARLNLPKHESVAAVPVSNFAVEKVIVTHATRLRHRDTDIVAARFGARQTRARLGSSPLRAVFLAAPAPAHPAAVVVTPAVLGASQNANVTASLRRAAHVKRPLASKTQSVMRSSGEWLKGASSSTHSSPTHRAHLANKENAGAAQLQLQLPRRAFIR
ncbi:hypothetical protein FB451DRAFT_1395288 [Mycena latifolia]|nr:hypothetical protein FB451DRAFT_1395288 [Mycena latifolia]